MATTWGHKGRPHRGGHRGVATGGGLHVWGWLQGQAQFVNHLNLLGWIYRQAAQEFELLDRVQRQFSQELQLAGLAQGHEAHTRKHRWPRRLAPPCHECDVIHRAPMGCGHGMHGHEESSIDDGDVGHEHFLAWSLT